MKKTSPPPAIWITVVGALVLIVILSLVGIVWMNSEMDALRRQLAAHQVQEAPPPAHEPPASTLFSSLLSSQQIDRLRARGLQNPVEDLRDDLMGNPEIIPHEGVLGGTMGFYMRDRIHVLTPEWVLAYFEDGHLAGHALLEYDVNDNGEITWQVVSTHML